MCGMCQCSFGITRQNRAARPMLCASPHPLCHSSVAPFSSSNNNNDNHSLLYNRRQSCGSFWMWETWLADSRTAWLLWWLHRTLWTLTSSISSPHRRMRPRYRWLSDDDEDEDEDEDDDDMCVVGRCGVKSYFLFPPTCWATTWTETTVSWKREYSALVQDTLESTSVSLTMTLDDAILEASLLYFESLGTRRKFRTITKGDLGLLSFHSAPLVVFRNSYQLLTIL